MIKKQAGNVKRFFHGGTKCRRFVAFTYKMLTILRDVIIFRDFVQKLNDQSALVSFPRCCCPTRDSVREAWRVYRRRGG